MVMDPNTPDLRRRVLLAVRDGGVEILHTYAATRHGYAVKCCRLSVCGARLSYVSEWHSEYTMKDRDND